MIHDNLLGSFRYCFGNRKSFITILLLAILLNATIFLGIVQAFVHQSLDWILGSFWFFIIIFVLMVGYGLVITRDLIDGGKGLPRMLTKDTLMLGLKGTPVLVIYSGIQIAVLDLVSRTFHFPAFELEEMILNYSETLEMIFTHQPIETVLFFAIGFVVFYVSTFFMEMAIAQLADSGRLLGAFSIRMSIRNIATIGWAKYAVDVNYVVLSFVVLTFISDLADSVPVLNFLVAIAVSMLIFVIQFGSIGLVFREVKGAFRQEISLQS